MRAYSKEFRREVLAACDSGHGTREVAQQFKVSESWVRRIKQVRRELGQIAPLSTRRRRPIWADDVDRIRTTIKESADLTLSELKARLQTTLSVTTLCRALKRLKLPLKKSRCHQNRTAPTSLNGVHIGVSGRQAWIRNASFLSTKHG